MKNSIEPKDSVEDQLLTEQLPSVPRADLVQPDNGGCIDGRCSGARLAQGSPDEANFVSNASGIQRRNSLQQTNPVLRLAGNTDRQHNLDDSGRLHWLLICPPDNWEEALPVSLAELRLLELLSLRLELVMSRDDKRRKVYLGLGKTGSSSTAPSDANEQDPNSPPIGVRFPSRWTADVVPDEEAGPEYEAIDAEAAAPLIPAFPDHQLSKNFRLSEFRPGEHSYDLIRISPVLVNTLEEIRKRAGGQPLHVTSGYRPPAYNRKVGGVSNSTHIDGLASDIYSDHMSVDELYDICDRVIGDRGGVGYYPTQGFIHVDLRGYRARW